MTRRRVMLGLVALVCLGAVLAFPMLASKFQLQLVARIMITAIFAMSLQLLVGSTGLVSLGHAAFYGIGAYALFLTSPAYGAASLWLSLPAALAAAAVAALIIGLLVLRSSGVYFIMVTLAFAQMFFYYVTGARWLGGSDGAYVYGRPEAAILGLAPVNLGDDRQFFLVVAALMVATYLLLRIIGRAPFGHAVQGIRVNEARMRSLGFPTFRYKLASFVIAGTLAGLAGYLGAAQFGVVTPDLFGWRQSGLVLMMVILGGAGRLYGAILGAFALVLLQEFLADLTRHWLLPMGLFVILAVLLLPEGLSGLRRRRPALRRKREPDLA